ncbi:MAG: hypothetical protein KAU12_01360 [Candidatus Omnitrophica bacterium]|nr:hypothetical protein [Candidatus Omnitrophota bacterium]
MAMTLLYDLFITLFIASIGFLIQVYPRIRNRYFGVDTWKLLEMADIIRKRGKLPKTMTDKYLIDGPFDYPPVFLYILSFFRKDFLEKNQWWISPFISALHGIIVFIVTYFLTRNLLIASIAQLVYCLTPIIIIESSQLSVRTFSQLIFSLTLLTILLSAHYQKPALFLLTLFMSVILILSHKFALQALVFLCVALSVWSFNFIYISIPFLAVLIAIVVSKGYYLTVLRGHLAILNFWRENIDYRFAHQIRGVKSKQNKNPDFINKVCNLLQRIPLLSLFGSNPFVFLLFLMFCLVEKTTALSFAKVLPSVYDLLVVWSVSLFGAAVFVILIKPIRFLGEAERYLEYSAAPTAILLSVLFYGAFSGKYSIIYSVVFIIWAFALTYMPTLLIQRKLVLKDQERSIREDLWKMMNYINNLNEDVRIATIPLYLISPVSYFVKCKILSTESALAHPKKLKDFCPILRKPLEDIFSRYQINYLLINNHYVSMEELPLKRKNIAKHIGQYYLLKI